MKSHSRTFLTCAALITCFAINNIANATVFKIHSFYVQFYEEGVPYTIFSDQFRDSNPPPSAPDFTNGDSASYSTVGTPGPEYIVGNRGTLELDTSLGEPRTSAVTGKNLLVQRNRLLTGINNENPELGLTLDKAIFVGGIYALNEPEASGERYGIRMTDFSNTNPDPNDIVEISVRRTSTGNVLVQYRQADFNNGVMTVLDQYLITNAHFALYDDIALGLFTGPDDNDVYAGFLLLDNSNHDNDIVHYFEATGNIFNSENWTRAEFIASQPTIDIDVDIKPNNESNNINPSSTGSLPVAVLTTEDFDALQVDPMTVQFGPAGAEDSHRRAHAKDVDDDGDIDLLFHFRTPETGIQCGDTEAVLMGETWDGASIRGTDSVNTVGCEADRLTYTYRGNSFEEVDGLIFTTNDRVTAQFTIDCAAAHGEGNCANLPYDNYLQLGAVELEPLSFSAGPAGLPTSDGEVEIAQFSFSTDSRGRIVDWDMDLFLLDPSGVINVDTDNRIGGPIDSAAALGGIAVVQDNPGEWTVEKEGSRKVMDKNKGMQQQDKKNKNKK